MFQKFLFILIPVAVGIAVYAAYAVFVPVSILEQQVFIIEKGENVRTVAKHLSERGLIRNNLLFVGYTALTGSSKKLQAGEYEFFRRVTVPAMVGKFIRGEVIDTSREVKIIEGWSIDDIADYLKAQGFIASRQEFLSLAYDFSKWEGLLDDSTAFLKTATENKSLEGFLFPDTYRVAKDVTQEDIIKKALANFALKLKPYSQEIQSPTRTLFQVVIMASLIEKEVPKSADRRIVSGILWKRLQAGYPLQVDATIAYLTGKNTAKITEDDLWIRSPYNTYRNSGLPPGPIANPGIDAIEAALRPEKSPFWFYLSASDGTTIFSKTFDEHKRAKAKYLQ